MVRLPLPVSWARLSRRRMPPPYIGDRAAGLVCPSRLNERCRPRRVRTPQDLRHKVIGVRVLHPVSRVQPVVPRLERVMVSHFWQAQVTEHWVNEPVQEILVMLTCSRLQGQSASSALVRQPHLGVRAEGSPAADLGRLHRSLPPSSFDLFSHPRQMVPCLLRGRERQRPMIDAVVLLGVGDTSRMPRPGELPPSLIPPRREFADIPEIIAPFRHEAHTLSRTPRSGGTTQSVPPSCH